MADMIGWVLGEHAGLERLAVSFQLRCRVQAQFIGTLGCAHGYAALLTLIVIVRQARHASSPLSAELVKR